MSKQFWRTLALIVVTMLTSLLLVVGQTFLVSATIPKQNVIAQVTSVSQISDVSQNHYYFEAFQSLIERYGCMVGYEDKTFRAARSLQGAEFISILKACTDKLAELQAASIADMSNAEDLGTIQKRLKEIEANVSSMRR